MNDDRLYTQDDLKEIMAAAAEGAALFTDTLARWFARTLDIPPGVALQHAKSIEREITQIASRNKPPLAEVQQAIIYPFTTSKVRGSKFSEWHYICSSKRSRSLLSDPSSP